MKFLFPQFLYALFAIAIPIIIHLFNFRKYKKIYFPSVRFLKEVKQETQSKSKLKHLLILLARILAIICLVFAFAQPYMPVENSATNAGDKVISIYIDNSFSMESVGNSGSLLVQAKQYAYKIADSYQTTDNYQLLTNDFEGRHQRLINQEDFFELLEEVEISPAVKKTSEVLSRQMDLLSDSDVKMKTIFLISDYQKEITDLQQLTNNDTSININLIPILAQKTNNLYIDSCWFATPIRQLNQPEQLFVKITNVSDNKYDNVPIKLHINGQQKALGSFSVEPNNFTETTLSFTLNTTGKQNAVISITDYPVTFDDKFYLSYKVAESISILNIFAQDTSSYIDALFGKDDFFILNNVHQNRLDYSSFSNNQLLILNELKDISSGLGQELKKFIQNGGSVLVFPNAEIDAETYQNFLLSLDANYFTELDTVDTKVETINLKHEIFAHVFDDEKIKKENLDMPIVRAHYRISKNIQTNEYDLLKLLNGDILLNEYIYGKGKIYLSSVPLHTDFSNFAQHALFVPTLYNIALFSQPSNPIFYTIGKDEMIELNSTNMTGEKIFHIKAENFDIIPEARNIGANTNIYLHHQITKAGNYSITLGNETIAAIAFNYDRKESDLNCYTVDELIEQYEKAGFPNFSVVETTANNFTQTLNEIKEGKKLWKLFIIFTLLFLAVEVLLIRLWRRT